VFLIGLIFIVMLVRMPADKVGELADRLLDLAVSGQITGYILFAAAVIGWVAHAKIMRRITYHEEERIGTEKSNLQQKLLDTEVKSSKKHNR